MTHKRTVNAAMSWVMNEKMTRLDRAHREGGMRHLLVRGRVRRLLDLRTVNTAVSSAILCPGEPRGSR